MPPDVRELVQWSHLLMSQIQGFSPQIQTTRPDALLCSVADSKYQNPFRREMWLSRMDKEEEVRTAMSDDSDQYNMLYPEPLGPI